MTSNPVRPMARAALLAAGAAGAAGMLVSVVFAGVPGLLGAIVGTVVSMSFLSISLLIARYTLHADPNVMMAAAMGSFVAKLVLFFAALLFVESLGWFDHLNRLAFGITAGAVALAFSVGEAIGHTRTRRLVWDAPGRPNP